MCISLGDRQLMLAAYVVKEVANVLNDRFVAAGFDQDAPKRQSTRCR